MDDQGTGEECAKSQPVEREDTGGVVERGGIKLTRKGDRDRGTSK